MSFTDRSDNLSVIARQDQKTFDYFVLTIAVTLLAYTSQHFAATLIGLNSGTLKLCAQIFLIASMIAGFRRITLINAVTALNARDLRVMEEHAEISSISNGGPMHHAQTGWALSAAEVPAKLGELRNISKGLKQHMQEFAQRSETCSTLRNWLFVLGVGCLLVANVWRAYEAAIGSA